MARMLVVHIEYPTGSRSEHIEIDDGLSDEEIADEAKEIFHNACNYGFEVIDAEDEQEVPGHG